jgi:hypothetical protein
VSLPDTSGATRSLSAYKGKFVVLEWVNFECPFVGKHYGSGHMQKLQKDYTGKGVVWLSVNSSATGQPGLLRERQGQRAAQGEGRGPTAYLLDTAGHRRPRLRRQDHAAHVHRGPEGHADLRGRHRRHPVHRPGGHRDREELRLEGAGRGAGGQAP